MFFSLIYLPAMLTTAAGVGLLYLSWCSNTAVFPWSRIGGWLLLFVAMVLWMAAGGIEAGMVIGVCLPGILALLLVVWHQQAEPVKRGRRNKEGGAEKSVLARQSGSQTPGTAVVTRNVAMFLLTVPFAAMTTVLVMMAVSMLLPWSELSRIVLLVIAAPALWGVMAAWLCSDDRLWRPVLAILFATMSSVPLMFLLA